MTIAVTAMSPVSGAAQTRCGTPAVPRVQADETTMGVCGTNCPHPGCGLPCLSMVAHPQGQHACANGHAW
jgi:hypothetical protein